MPLHIIKLCVGVETVEELDQWIREHRLGLELAGLPPEQTHVTRMFPKRADEVLDGGSLYWVIKGFVQVRQRILDLRPETGEDGIERCAILLDPDLVRTEMQPRRPFQGWRYLRDAEAPRDQRTIAGGDDIHPEMRRALAELALL